MKAFDFSVPTRVFFGAGELKRLKEVSLGLGKKAMLLAAKQTMKQTGILDRAAELLRQGGVEVVVSDALAGTWSLVPVMPERLTPTMLPAALAPSVTTPAASQLDLTLPAGFMGSMATAAPAGQVTDGATPVANVAADDGQVTVALVQAWTSQSPGVVSVSVPQDMITSGRGFSFALPASLVEAAGGEKLRVTQRNGGRLPSWLLHERGSNRISAKTVEAGALPIELLVRSNTQRWVLSISERAGN